MKELRKIAVQFRIIGCCFTGLGSLIRKSYTLGGVAAEEITFDDDDDDDDNDDNNNNNNNNRVHRSFWEHRLSMSPFHFCLSAARNLSSFQLLPASLITDLLQLFFGLPLFLFP